MDFTTFCLVADGDSLILEHSLCDQFVGMWFELTLNDAWVAAKDHVESCPALR